MSAARVGWAGLARNVRRGIGRVSVGRAAWLPTVRVAAAAVRDRWDQWLAGAGRPGAGGPRAGGPRGNEPGAGTAPGFVAPRITVEVSARVPGALVRVLPAVLVVLVGELVRAGPLAGTLLAVVAVALVVRPALPAVAGVVLVAGLAVLTGPDLLAPPGTTGGTSLGGGPGVGGVLGPLRLGVLVLALDATVRVAALAPHVAWTGWVERSVLTGVGRAVLRTQVLVQPVAWLAYAVRAGGSDSDNGDVLRLVALVAVAVLLGLLVPHRRRSGGSP